MFVPPLRLTRDEPWETGERIAALKAAIARSPLDGPVIDKTSRRSGASAAEAAA